MESTEEHDIVRALLQLQRKGSTDDMSGSSDDVTEGSIHAFRTRTNSSSEEHSFAPTRRSSRKRKESNKRFDEDFEMDMNKTFDEDFMNKKRSRHWTESSSASFQVGSESDVYGGGGFNKTSSTKVSGKKGNRSVRQCDLVAQSLATPNTELVNLTSEYIGVFFTKSCQPAQAQCKDKDGCTIHLGSFPSEIEAARAYDKYIVENKIHRRINFRKFTLV
jgi:hypothetical protein